MIVETEYGYLYNGVLYATHTEAEMEEMTAPELNAFLENLAKLIEASAQNVTEAVRLVRESKVKA